MSTAFLSPAGAGAPPARSPFADAALAAGGQTEPRDGWEVATSFGDPGAEADACAAAVGFADSSQLGKLELQGAPARLDQLVGTFEPGAARRQGGGWICPVAPGTRLLLRDPGAGEWGSELGVDPAVRGCDLSAVLAALTVVGPRARDLFARFCALDLREASLPPHGFRPGSVARTPGYLLREDADRFLVLVGAAYAEYVWEVVADAAAALGGRPVGVDSLPELSAAPHA